MMSITAFLRRFTLRQKILLSVSLFILLSNLIAGTLGYRSAEALIRHQQLDEYLPALLEGERNALNGEFETLKQATRQIAENPFLLNFAAQGFPAEQEPQLIALLNQVKQQFNLTTTTFVDRQSNRFWNQDGFLRVLNPQQDGWYFPYRDSGRTWDNSIHREANGNLKLFVNYQQTNGRGMSGLAQPLDAVIARLRAIKIKDSGFVFLTDGSGNVRLHPDNNVKDMTPLSQLYQGNSATLLNPQHTSVQESSRNGVPVLVVSSLIPALNWYLVAEVPQSEVFASLQQLLWQLLSWGIGGGIVMLLIAALVTHRLLQPLSESARLFTELGDGSGDLQRRLPAQGQDELAQLARGFNRFADKIQHSLQAVADTANALRTSAEKVAEESERSRLDSHAQRDKTLMVVTAINQMGATVQEIAGNASVAADATQGAEHASEQGLTIVGNTKQTIQNLADDMQNMGSVITTLAGQTESIGTILDTIRGISDQTNLLALNAAIEAARAGEQGRGFAVVAEEVRKLASRTSDSTAEIQSMIDRLQQEAQHAVQASSRSHERSLHGVQSAEEVQHSLNDIAARIAQLSDMNTQVAAATEEQSTVVQDINQNLDSINQLTEQNAGTAELLSEQAAGLRSLSQQLEQLVSAFRV